MMASPRFSTMVSMSSLFSQSILFPSSIPQHEKEYLQEIVKEHPDGNEHLWLELLSTYLSRSSMVSLEKGFFSSPIAMEEYREWKMDHDSLLTQLMDVMEQLHQDYEDEGHYPIWLSVQTDLMEEKLYQECVEFMEHTTL
jgi:hypothetical protein